MQSGTEGHKIIIKHTKVFSRNDIFRQIAKVLTSRYTVLIFKCVVYVVSSWCVLPLSNAALSLLTRARAGLILYIPSKLIPEGERGREREGEREGDPLK